MYRTVIGIAVALAIGLGIVGLTFSANRDEPADFVFANGTEPKSLDPHIMTGQPEGRIATALFEGLAYRDPKSLEPVPGMAKSWSVSSDGRTYTFKMRPGVTWNDGTPITAEDFAYSWRRLQEPELASEYAYFMHMIKWAAEYNTYEGNVFALIGLPPAKNTEEDKREADEQRRALTKIADRYLASHDVQAARAELNAWTKLRKAEKRQDVDGTMRSVPIRGVIHALDELIGRSDGPVDRDAWIKFMERQRLAQAIKNTKQVELQQALAASDQQWPIAKLTEIRGALIIEALTRWSQWIVADQRFGKTEGVFAPDPSTLIVELRAPTPYFLEVVSFYSALPVPKHVVDVEGNNDDWFRHEKIVSNGPFEMVAWRVNDRIRLKRSKTYWSRKTVRIETIDALPISDATAALNLYLTDELDWAQSPPPDVIDVLKTREDFRTTAALGTYYYRFNCTKPPFSSAHVRLATCMAVNRDEIVKGVLRGGQEPAIHFVPPGIPAYEPPPSRIRFDPDAARTLFKEGLAEFKNDDGTPMYPDGVVKQTLHLLYNTNEVHSKVADTVADHLYKHLGLRVKPINQEWQAYQVTTRALDYDLARAAWIGDYMDPNTFLDMWETNGGNNQTGWSSPIYDQLLRFGKDPEQFLAVAEQWIPKLKEPERMQEAVALASDAETRGKGLAALRMQCFREAEAILFQDQFPIMPLYYYVWQSMVSPRVRGWYEYCLFPDGSKKPNMKDIHPLRGIWIDQGSNAGSSK